MSRSTRPREFSRSGSAPTIASGPPHVRGVLGAAGARLAGTELAGANGSSRPGSSRPPSRASLARTTSARSAASAAIQSEALGDGAALGDERFEFLLSHGKVHTVDRERWLILAELPDNPGFLIAYRAASAREQSPERLHLDRRRLASCPQLEGEERLQLVDYQSNHICRIEHLAWVPNLVFLDLYNNKVQRIENLEPVRNLRVLILGKNQLGCIENLSCLSQLDTLDLHGNNIARIENLDHLRELRVLNLAGNRLQQLRNLSGLDSLTELNLRRNQLGSVAGIEVLGQLERVFVSHNWIAGFEGIEPLGRLGSLLELELEGNPVCCAANCWAQVVALCRRLSQLDSKEVQRRALGDAERRHASTRSPSKARGATSLPPPVPKDAGAGAGTMPSAYPCSPSGQGLHNGNIAARGRSEPTTKQLLFEEVLREIRMQWEREVSGGRVPSTQNYFVQRKCTSELVLLGSGSLEALDKPEYWPAVTSLHFRYLAVEVATAEVARLARFESLSSLSFGANQIFSARQLDALRMLPRLVSLTVRENPVCELRSALRTHAVRLLPELREFNGRKISSDERDASVRIFEPLEQLSATASVFGSPSGHASEQQVMTILEEAVARAVSRSQSLGALHDCFELVVRDTWDDVWEEAVVLHGHR